MDTRLSLEGSKQEIWGIIQCYLLGSTLFIALLAGLAFNAVTWQAVARTLLTCGVLTGLYVLLVLAMRQAGTAALAMVVLLICLPLVPALRYPLYILGAIGCVFLFGRGWLVRGRSLLALPVLMVTMLGSGIYIDYQYKSALLAGGLTLDSYFHAAIAAMYGHYGVASLGLNGLVPIGYHTLSHKIFAGLAALSGFETLASYAYFYIGMGPLLLAFSLAGLACRLNRQLPFWRALLSIALLFLASIAVRAFAISALWDSYIASESYLVSLVLLAASLSTFVRCIEAERGMGFHFSLAVALLLLVCAGLAKGSVGVIGLCVFGLFGLTRFRTAAYWVTVLLASALMYFLIVAAANSAEKVVFVKPFDFVETFVSGPLFTDLAHKLWFFLAVHFLPVWLCFGAGMRSQGLAYVKGAEFQVLFALLVPALALSLTLYVPGGSAYYFSSIPVVVALPFLAARLASGPDRVGLGQLVLMAAAGLALSALFRELGWIGTDAVSLALVVVLPLLLVGFLPMASSSAAFAYVTLLVAVSAFALQGPILKRTFLARSERSPVDLSDTLGLLDRVRAHTPYDVFIKVENPETLVAKIGCKAYWLLPALLERPLVDGLPNTALCPGFKGTYGLGDYSGKSLVPLGAKVENLRLAP
ncbi:hypothetical protein ACKI2N_014725 [Cupriavidus sp. 30B13]|uniref:hypothetical protein n=1 Tax=Cupriavidus sp. 30B13 TaxID=3384241 RepID=UPI003B920EDF